MMNRSLERRSIRAAVRPEEAAEAYPLRQRHRSVGANDARLVSVSLDQRDERVITAAFHAQSRSTEWTLGERLAGVAQCVECASYTPRQQQPWSAGRVIVGECFM